MLNSLSRCCIMSWPFSLCFISWVQSFPKNRIKIHCLFISRFLTRVGTIKHKIIECVVLITKNLKVMARPYVNVSFYSLTNLQEDQLLNLQMWI